MKKIILATALLALGSASAFAADLPERGMVAKAPMMAPISAWQGFYIGGNVGYGWGNGTTTLSPEGPVFLAIAAPASLDAKSKGVIGGAQIGYNWQMGSLVTGLESDIQGSGIEGSSQGPVPAPGGGFFNFDSLSTTQKLSWFGTVRGRFGVTVTPDLLLYATGGFAYGQVKDSALAHFDTDFPASVSKTKVGWAAGAGAEWMFARNWSTKLEYLYADLGNVSGVALQTPDDVNHFRYDMTWKSQYHIVRAGVNYHF